MKKERTYYQTHSDFDDNGNGGFYSKPLYSVDECKNYIKEMRSMKDQYHLHVKTRIEKVTEIIEVVE